MVNITILAASRPRLIKQTLDSIGDLTDATVTIRDAGMNTEVGQIARGFGGAESAYVLAKAPLGTGDSRNMVIRCSEYFFGRGDYLYISDDDCFWTRPDWLSILISVYEEAWRDGFRVVGAYNHPYHQPNATIRVSEAHVVHDVYSLASQSMLMRWEVWDQFGPFCQTPAGKVCQSEDVDFCNRVRDAGYKVGVISPALLVNCGITNSFGEKIPGWDLVKKDAPAGVVVE